MLGLNGIGLLKGIGFEMLAIFVCQIVLSSLQSNLCEM